MRTIGVGAKIAISLLALTSFSILLSNYSVYAEESSVSTATVTINQSCSMVGTTNTAHTANLANGTYSGSNYPNGIGQTTLKVFCNDNAGFAIYAIGYTGNEYGNTKLHNDTLGTANDISTGIYTSSTTVSSTWSMKLASVSGTYAPTITDGTNNTENFTTWHTIPTTYTKVAYRTSTTDTDNNGQGTGSSLTTTYDAYVSATQPAGTYIGQVKYTLVHPNTAPEPVVAGKVGVTYNANGSIFNGGTTTNRVVYVKSPMYIANNPQITKSSNISSDGTKESSYTSSESVFTPVTATGASKMKVVVQYGLSSNAGLAIIEGNWDGNSTPTNYEMISGENTTGTTTYTFDGDAVTFYMMAEGEPASGYDYGFFAQIYPVYATEQTDTSESEDFVTLAIDSGVYAQTTDWYGSWYATINSRHYDFTSEVEIRTFISDNIASLSGTNIELYRGLTINEAYAKANRTQFGGYYIQQDMNNNMCQTVAISQNGTVKDSRDSNIYMIGKLRDGRCWMLDNLALDPTDITTAANMNASNTNATAEAIYNYLNGGSSNTGWSSIAVVAATTGFDFRRIPMINNQSKDTLVTSYGPASTNGQAKVGIYYNYCAATIGTYCYSNNNGIDVPDTLIDAPQDICPAGWRMPTGGSSGEYGKLYGYYNTTETATNSASLQYNLSTSLSGGYGDNTSQGRGYWWSSTNNGGSAMSGLRVESDSVASAPLLWRNYGYSVRCLVSD